ncbi:bifunctional [glutamate--ammonia ligase]-adenylyl-L-tyrosine phosphorylase/[glutamate--ammonia-ligase] adenylyltransferase [Moritella sp. 24]|uniref:bifunctional [glutamate--ammonia ligase]-adenylyl-L-tyrosine phosphorylase/[glutamate--ammonia-ligase] adenylyltransferase n=1 Tax=Moritella sp. 24 TaxID=2746230 RepID=UPI001BAC2849|nr:bifunctional [glutamate--ammonia ligase]-adenylyl-L-tyrosine phosphorylase/[glutamate--ammonia-ligase] adenylyltransferase [Moritella sp. 24]QUM78130.1 bifunctional [glutamate--ammonia ligase]-adenylyl-L-tyrosine phosphorylase/[glutamate--ammonia-ligase] adenylyltransferase [Moritella sp. 24]
MSTENKIVDVLAETGGIYWQRWCERHESDLALLSVEQITQSQRVFSLSDFIAESCINNIGLLTAIWQSGLLSQSSRTAQVETQLATKLAACDSETALLRTVRQFRRFHMCIIAWRELLQQADLKESLTHTSHLADSLIEGALEWLYQLQCKEQGTPVNEAGVKQQLVILAMGKLGGGELNFSSDIDLIFTYPETGETVGAGRTVSNQKFFQRLGQRLIAALHQLTMDGFAYRVDMRLRPFGDSGPLVMSFNAFEEYYQNQGRDWERYAMVKARALGGNAETRIELEKMLRPFIYRRYVDFSAIDALRNMKAMIKAEVRRKGLKDNIKLGSGGIREVEFVAQTFQLIRGGREPVLQIKSLLVTLKELASLGEISPESYTVLTESYCFLRQVENILQQINDCQTQTLPQSELDRSRLISVLGFADWDSFYVYVNQVMANIHTEFSHVIGGDDDDHEESLPALDLWHLELSTDEAVTLLAEYGLAEQEAQTFARDLNHFKTDYARKTVGPRGRQTIEKLLPKLLFSVLKADDPVALLPRIIALLLKILNRTAYLELLAENDLALTQLLRLCSASSMVAKQLSSHPILLDELLVPSHLYHPTPLHEYRSELRQFMLRIPEEDQEQQLEALRQYKQTQLLRIAAADIGGELALMKVSDHLTWLAEAVIDNVVNLAWQQLTEKHGIPHNVVESGEKGFAVVAYGKLGGIELGYGSDLDLVFIHNCETAGMTNGDKVIDSRQFYLRLAQRIIHIFSTRTSTGILYEVDMRLRPSGNSGVLACPVSRFLDYQSKEAWTWEHQSLVRTRLVYGDKLIQARFTDVKRTIIAKPRDTAELKKQVVEMRLKMRGHLLKAPADKFDIKQSAGGITDIEFMMQFMVLSYAAQIPKMQLWPDNVRIISRCVAEGLISEALGLSLTNSYCQMRDEIHRLNLLGKKGIVADSEFVEQRKVVTDYWQQLFAV